LCQRQVYGISKKREKKQLCKLIYPITPLFSTHLDFRKKEGFAVPEISDLPPKYRSREFPCLWFMCSPYMSWRNQKSRKQLTRPEPDDTVSGIELFDKTDRRWRIS
jgi:hypothetical protein